MNEYACQSSYHVNFYMRRNFVYFLQIRYLQFDSQSLFSTDSGSSIMFNPLRAEYFRGNIKIYLHFMSLLHIDMTHVPKIRPQVRPGPTYST